MLQNIFVWIVTFAVASLLESSARVLLIHTDWNARSMAQFSVMNLLLACALGIAGGLLYSILILVVSRITRWKRLLDFLLPAVGAAVAGFLSLGLYNFRYLLPQHPAFFRRLFFLACLAVLYLLCRKLSIVLSGRLRYGLILLMILFPLSVFCVQYVRESSGMQSGANKGPVRSVVLISIDTLRYDYLSCYGSKEARTPNIDRVAQEGVRFEVAISPVPETGPAHASMFTGRDPLENGILFNGERLPKRAWTVTEQLRKYGFRTAGFISGLPMTSQNSGLNQGFQVYEDDLALIDSFHKSWAGMIVEKTKLFQPGILKFGKDVTNPALSWIENNSDKSFFLFLHYYDVHYPYDFEQKRKPHPQRIRSKPQDLSVQKKLYANAAEYVDNEIGRVVHLLQQKGIYDRTLLIITADHGESLGEHNYYYDHHKKVYEQTIRVPLMIRSPLSMPTGVLVKQQVSIMDIPRTVLASIGIQQNEFWGYDLIALAKNLPANYDRVTISHSFETQTDSLRTQNWKLIRSNMDSKPVYELYDLESDPDEIENLFQTQTGIAERLMNQLTRMVGKGRYRKRMEELSREQQEQFRSLGYFQ